MPVSMYGIRASQRLPANAAASVTAPTASVHPSISDTCDATLDIAVKKLDDCGTLRPKKLRTCAAMIRRPAPAVNPTTTVVEMKLTSAPSRAMPSASLMSPIIRQSVNTSWT